MRYFVTAIGTDSGKTLVSAIVTEALQADYWKPVQAGEPRDTATVQSLITNSRSRFHPESYMLHTPASPHAAAKIDRVEIRLDDIKPPETENHLVVEGAGGLLVPLNNNDCIIDLIRHLDMEVILVSNLYLGSINHTLLSCEALSNRNINVKGIIFNGPSNSESEDIILNKSTYPQLLKIDQLPEVNKDVVANLAAKLRPIFYE
ncbi:MAG: dethiobiotin synthase [Cyclobacteriaceae bacterium]